MPTDYIVVSDRIKKGDYHIESGTYSYFNDANEDMMKLRKAGFNAYLMSVSTYSTVALMDKLLAVMDKRDAEEFLAGIIS